MCTSIIFSGIMIYMQTHDPSSLFNRFKIQSQTEYLLILFQRETDIGFPIDHFKTDILLGDRQGGFSHFPDSIELGTNIQFTQQVNLLRSTDRNIPHACYLFFPFDSSFVLRRIITCTQNAKSTDCYKISSHISHLKEGRITGFCLL